LYAGRIREDERQSCQRCLRFPREPFFSSGTLAKDGTTASLLASLTATERDFVERLLRVIPDYRYEPGGGPEVRRWPAPGLESAVVAAKMVSASAKLWI
jgi:hypothetical protein